MSPLPSSCSAPLPSRIVRESIFDDTRNEMRAGRFALIRPVMTSTDGRCVARIRWMPTARAICASRAIDSSTSLLATIIRSASSSMTTTMKGSGLGVLAVLRRALLGDRLLDVAVVLLDVADAFGRERLVALFHLAHRPAQRVRRLLRIDDDRRQQVRDVLVHPELEPLRIDHDHPHVVGRRAVEDAGQHRVQADRLAGAGRSGDQQVRHRRQIGHVRLAVDGLAERERQLRGRALVGVGLEQLAQRDLLAVAVRDLDADGRLAGDAIDQHRLGLHRQAQVVGEAGDLAVLHAGVGLELEGRDDRARDESARPSLRPRTRGTSPRAAARRPSARARRSCARPSAHRAAPAGGSVYSPLRRSAGAFAVGSGSDSGSGGAGMLTLGGFGGANDSRRRTAGGRHAPAPLRRVLRALPARLGAPRRPRRRRRP